MPKDPSLLFGLIKSLSSKEVLDITRSFDKTEGECLELFKIILHQKEFSQENVKNQIGKKTSAVELAKLKKALQDIIVNYLVNNDKRIRRQIQETIVIAEILLARGNYVLSFEYLEKAKKEATKYEFYDLLLGICELEFYIYKNYSLVLDKKYELSLEEIDEDVKTYTHLNSIFLTFLKQDAFLTENQIKGDKRIGADKQFLEIDAAKKRYAKEIRTSKKILLAATKNDFRILLNKKNSSVSDQVDFFSKQLLVFKDNPFLIKLNSGDYIAALVNSASYYVKINRKKTLELITKLIEFNEEEELSAPRSNYFTTQLSHIYITIGESLKALDRLEKYSSLYSTQNKIILYKRYIYALMCIGRYKEANNWLIKLTDEIKLNSFSQTASFTYVYKIIIQFELGKYELCLSTMDTAYKYWKTHDTYIPSFQLFLNFMKKSIKGNTNENDIHFKKELESILKKSSAEELLLFTHFDLLVWIESKIHHTTMDAIYKLKFAGL